jgi:cation diffusion facilitator CzcD-associated flavoprotein CzcO
VTVMEQSRGVGRQWLYDPRTKAGDPLGLASIHSGIYASLRLIVPREAMSFFELPFYPRNGGDGRRYPGHGEFVCYIREFCDTFGLMDAVRLNTRVLRVAAMAADGCSPPPVRRPWSPRRCSTPSWWPLASSSTQGSRPSKVNGC